MKWYWWVLLGLAILLSFYVIMVGIMNNPKKIEKAIIDSSPDNQNTAKSSTYKTIARVAEDIIVRDLAEGRKIVAVKDTQDRRPGYSACGHFISQDDLNANYGGSSQAWVNEVCYGQTYTGNKK